MNNAALWDQKNSITMDKEESAEETVYGTTDDGQNVMSESVQALAASVYKEFERMIKAYDENVVKELMPLVVGILEALDSSYLDKQSNEVEVELLRDDNEQLLTQYEREKQLRKTAEQKYLEVEDAIEEERKEFEGKTESLESILRMFELKAKNAQDHISRLEEKESEMRKDYNKLHERYTEIFKTHMDYMERTKILMGTDRLMEIPAAKAKGFHLPNLKSISPAGEGITPVDSTPGHAEVETPTGEVEGSSPQRSLSSNTSLRNEMRDIEGAAVNTKEEKDNRNKSIDNAEKELDPKSDRSNKATDSLNENQNCKHDAAEDQRDGAAEHDMSKHDRPSVIDAKPDDEGLASPTETSANEKLNRSLDGADVNEHDLSWDADSSVQKYEPEQSKEVEDVLVIPDEVVPPMKENTKNYKQYTYLGDAPELEEFDDTGYDKANNIPIAGASHGPQNESSIFDELQFHGAAVEVDDGLDITGKVISPGEYSSSVNDNFFGRMGKEVENLILENTELLATKNALNVVKDDLIAKVDELSSEQEILREEILSLQTVKERLKQRVTELEDEVKKSKEELEKVKNAKTEDNEEDVPMAQRKRFTRVEMARVLMERNQYKERLMELQEAVRWTEMIRASREHPDLEQNPKKKSSIWNFFGNLVGSAEEEATPPPQPSPKRKGYGKATVI